MAICLDDQCPVIAAGDLRRYSMLDFQVHAAVYEASGNQYLKEVLETIKNKMRPIPLSIDIKPILDKLYEDHVRLYDALKSREADRAEEVFAAHNQFMMTLITEESVAGRWNQLGIAGKS